MNRQTIADGNDSPRTLSILEYAFLCAALLRFAMYDEIHTDTNNDVLFFNQSLLFTTKHMF